MIENPFNGGAALATMVNMARYNPLADAGGRLGDIAQLNARDELAGMMASNGGNTNASMNPLAMLTNQQTQNQFNAVQDLARTDRGLDQDDTQLGISQQNADTASGNLDLSNTKYTNERSDYNQMGNYVVDNYGKPVSSEPFDMSSVPTADLQAYAKSKYNITQPSDLANFTPEQRAAMEQDIINHFTPKPSTSVGGYAPTDNGQYGKYLSTFLEQQAGNDLASSREIAETKRASEILANTNRVKSRRDQLVNKANNAPDSGTKGLFLDQAAKLEQQYGIEPTKMDYLMDPELGKSKLKNERMQEGLKYAQLQENAGIRSSILNELDNTGKLTPDIRHDIDGHNWDGNDTPAPVRVEVADGVMNLLRKNNQDSHWSDGLPFLSSDEEFEKMRRAIARVARPEDLKKVQSGDMRQLTDIFTKIGIQLKPNTMGRDFEVTPKMKRVIEKRRLMRKIKAESKLADATDSRKVRYELAAKYAKYKKAKEIVDQSGYLEDAIVAAEYYLGGK